MLQGDAASGILPFSNGRETKRGPQTPQMVLADILSGCSGACRAARGTATGQSMPTAIPGP